MTNYLYNGVELPDGCLTFSSAVPFTIAVASATRSWDGTLYYSNDASMWNEWDGTTAIASAEHGGEQRIYMRGVGNSVITGETNANSWLLTGSSIRCDGNIENILDYETVANGEHPTMGDSCYRSLFFNCTALTSAPELPATTLEHSCYYYMFKGCTALTTAPELPATTVAGNCYANMFQGCTGLTTAPELPATTMLSTHCYYCMFQGCTGLTTIPALPATTLKMFCYGFMFEGCTGIKLSTTQTNEYKTEYRIPISGTGTSSIGSLDSMFRGTGGTFTGTPSINTTYYMAVPDEPEPEEPVLPDPLPLSPYLPINGAWAKHDIYKQVGNQWVKQPQGAVEVEGGAWSALS